MKKTKYSWKQFDKDVETLTRKIKRSQYKPATLIALARGGLCLGTKLSHSLKQPLMIVSAKTYNDSKQQVNTVLLNSSYTVPLKSPILICDEIADTGKTLRIIVDHFKLLGVDIKTATLLYKERSIVKPDFYAKETPNDTWIVFPWEE